MGSLEKTYSGVDESESASRARRFQKRMVSGVCPKFRPTGLGGAIFIGALTVIAAIPLIATMLVAIITVQFKFGYSSVKTIGLTANGPLFGPPGYEINLLYIAAIIALMLYGPGMYSVDQWLASKKGIVDPPIR